MKTLELVKTNFKVVAIDQTSHWSERLQELCGKIETVYLVDCGFVTHCCELTPSYDLTPLYYIIDKDVSEEIQEEVMNEIGKEENQYFHVTFINSLKSVNVNNNIEVEDSECDEYKEHFAEVEEYVRCNHQI